MTKARISALAVFVAAASALRLAAQAPPAITYDAPSSGFSLPTPGQFVYSLSGGQTGYIGYGATTANKGGSSATATQLNGSLSMLTESQQHPFSLLYGGGMTLFENSVGTSLYFQSLQASQQYLTEHWSFLVSDTFRITPDIAIGGLSGVAGAGDLGNGTAGGSAAGYFSPNQTRIEQTAEANAEARITGSSSINFGGGYELIHATGNYAFANSNTLFGNATFKHRVDGRTNVSGVGTFMRNTQDSTGSEINAFSGQFSLDRSTSPLTSFSVSVGPQYIRTSYNGKTSPLLTYFAKGSFFHQTQFSQINASFDHEVHSTPSAGGANETLTANFTYTRGLSPWLRVSLSANYLRTVALPGAVNLGFKSNGLYFGGQANRSLGEHWSAFVSYTAEKQNYSGTTLGVTPLLGLEQIIGAGVTYTPLPVHLHGH